MRGFGQDARLAARRLRESPGFTAAAILSLEDARIAEALAAYRAAQTEQVLAKPDPRLG